jgi:hypothetical protein
MGLTGNHVAGQSGAVADANARDVLLAAHTAALADKLDKTEASSTFAPMGGVRHADQFAGATVRDKIDAAIADLGGGFGVVVLPSGMGAGSPSVEPTNATLWDERGGLPVDGGIAINARTPGVADRMRIHQWTTNPDRSVVALDTAQDISGTMCDPSSAEGLTGQVRLMGALLNSPTSGFALVGVEGNVSVYSTGNTIARARGGTFNVFLKTGSTTNVTSAEAVTAQTITNSGTGTLTNAYGLFADDQSAGTVRNYSIYTGHVLIRNNRNIDAEDSTGTPRRIITLASSDLVVFRPLSDTVGIKFANQANTISWMTLTSTAATIGVPITFSEQIVLASNKALRIGTGGGQMILISDGTGTVTITGPAVQTKFVNAAGTVTNLSISDAGIITLRDGGNIVLGATTGTIIGTAPTQKLGFYGATPVVRPAGTPGNASDLATAITLLNSIRTSLYGLGLVSN